MLHVSIVIVNIGASRSSIQTFRSYLASVAIELDITRSIAAVCVEPDQRVWIEGVSRNTVDRPIVEYDLRVLSAYSNLGIVVLLVRTVAVELVEGNVLVRQICANRQLGAMSMLSAR